MKVLNEGENLMFDDQDSRCFMKIQSCQGKLFAFLICLDLGWPDCRLSKPHLKLYWGRFSWEDQEGSIREIMETGAKWNDIRSLGT